MHPIFRTKANFLLYISLWFPLGALLGLVLWNSARLSGKEAFALAAPLAIVFAFVALSPWYSCRAMPLTATPVWKLLLNHGVAAQFAAAAMLLLARALAAGLEPFFPALGSRLRSGIAVIAGMIVLMYLLSIAFHYVVLTVAASREAEVLARAAELRALKSQLNPHFLFNSLHSISALTTIDPARARDMCIRLSDFLRTSLRLGECASIAFSQELELTKMYLDVEQVRFGARLRVTQSVEPGCEGCDVPPLLVQPLVENAIKHGIATMTAGGEVRLQARLVNGGIQLSIENPFDPEAPAERQNGIGLRNVRERLRARYGDRAELEILAGADSYRVNLSIPCEGVR